MYTGHINYYMTKWLYLNKRVFAAIFMISEREFRFVDDGELIDVLERL